MTTTIRAWALLAATAVAAGGAAAQETAMLTLTRQQLVIPQVDYEPAVTASAADGLPRIDLKAVGWDRVVDKTHEAVVLESDWLRVTLLPAMGRVYSMVYKPTGHETLWRNDVARPGGANNRTGWWLWIGGIEYTLPGEEHGYTWALPWDWEVVEDSDRRKAVEARIVEPTTGLEETIHFSLDRGSAALETHIRLHNPTADTAEFAHWVNPMWAPGGRNELTDDTELIIPTEHIVIPERWQRNLGDSPQAWATSPLRFLRNWRAMGDLEADGLRAGFYGVYSHDEDEGVARVFDPLSNPGVDVWTYGFHPDTIPMGSGAPNKGYAEMWGGTVKTFPDERGALAPGQSLAWTEWIVPFQQTAGLTYADRDLAARVLQPAAGLLEVRLCPMRALEAGRLEVRALGRTVHGPAFTAAPDRPWTGTFSVPPEAAASQIVVVVRDGAHELARLSPEPTP